MSTVNRDIPRPEAENPITSAPEVEFHFRGRGVYLARHTRVSRVKKSRLDRNESGGKRSLIKRLAVRVSKNLRSNFGRNKRWT